MNRILLSAALLLGAWGMGMADDEVANKETVIELLGSGFTSEEIISFIENATTKELTSDIATLKELKAAGADAALITYLQANGKKDASYQGLYMWNPANGEPTVLRYTPIEKEKKGFGGGLLGAAVSFAGEYAGMAAGSAALMNASFLTGDILDSSNLKSEKLIIKGAHAAVSSAPGQMPVFRFYLPKDKNLYKEIPWYGEMLQMMQNPAEFQCIKMVEKKDKRTIPKGMTWGLAGFDISHTGGQTTVVPFDVKQLNDRIFEVSFPEGLEAGEYCFFYTRTDNSNYTNHLGVYDFRVQ